MGFWSNFWGFVKKKIDQYDEEKKIQVKIQPWEDVREYNPQKTEGKPYKAKSGETTSSNFGKFNGNHYTENKDGKRCPLTVLNFSGEHNKGKQHPTQKPIDLLEWIIKTYTNAEETVLDNCMGVGSCGVACINTNRNFIGIELDKVYFDIAEKRIKEAQNI